VNRFAKLLFLSSTLLALPTPSQAGFLVNGSKGFAFTSFTMGNNQENGSPYWNQHSEEKLQIGSQKGKAITTDKFNIGYFLTHTGAYQYQFGATSPALSAKSLSYWGNPKAGNSIDPNLSIKSTSKSITATLHLTLTNQGRSDVLGWYQQSFGDKPGLIQIVRHILFKGNTLAQATTMHSVTFTPDSHISNGTFGLFLETNANSKNPSFFYSDSYLNPKADNLVQTSLVKGGTKVTTSPHQHFALFNDAQDHSLWFGVQDTLGMNPTEKTGSFNDMVVSLNAAPSTAVPEPASILLAGLGGVGAWSMVRRRRTAG
jgi:hypothetical protein